MRESRQFYSVYIPLRIHTLWQLEGARDNSHLPHFFAPPHCTSVDRSAATNLPQQGGSGNIY
jgi:hypothetical protein